MIIYGICRFALNFMRADLSIFLLGMPAGHFWSVVSVIVGAVWLYKLRHAPAVTAGAECTQE